MDFTILVFGVIHVALIIRKLRAQSCLLCVSLKSLPCTGILRRFALGIQVAVNRSFLT